MPVPFSPAFTLAGGVDLGSPTYRVAANRLPTAVNYYNDGVQMKGRYGMKAHVVPLFGADREDFDQDFPPIITGLHQWSRVGPPRETALYAGTADSIARFDRASGAWQELLRGASSGAPRYAWSDEPWHFIQYNQIMYAFRAGVGMRRVSEKPNFDLPPGIEAPTGAATAANAGAGATTGSFNFRYVFRNPLTGQMSNGAPVSNTVAAAGNLIQLTGIQTSTNPQVGQRRIFASLPGRTGEWFFLMDINNNTDSVSPAFDVDVNALGELMSARNTVPPSGLLFGVIWQERLWASDGRNLYASEIGMPESIPGQNVLSIFPDDGQEITGLVADEGRLYIGRTKSVIYLTGTVSTLERHILDDANGVVSHGSFKLVDGRLIWFTGTDFMESTGGPGRSITSVGPEGGNRVGLYMKYLNQDDARKTVAEVWPQEKLYVFLGRWNQSWEQDQEDGHPHTVSGSDILAYNYETGAWWPWRFRSIPAHSGGTLQPSMALRAVIDHDGEQKLLCGYRTGVNHLLAPNYGYDDLVIGSSPIRFTFAIDWEAGLPELRDPAGAQFGLRRLTLTGLTQRRHSMSFLAYAGGRYLSADLLKSRPISLPDSWDYSTTTTGPRPLIDLPINVGTRGRAVPGLFVKFTITAQEASSPSLSTKPPVFASAVLDCYRVQRRRRSV